MPTLHVRVLQTFPFEFQNVLLSGAQRLSLMTSTGSSSSTTPLLFAPSQWPHDLQASLREAEGKPSAAMLTRAVHDVRTGDLMIWLAVSDKYVVKANMIAHFPPLF